MKLFKDMELKDGYIKHALLTSYWDIRQTCDSITGKRFCQAPRLLHKGTDLRVEAMWPSYQEHIEVTI